MPLRPSASAADRPSVAACQRLGLALRAALPDRADRMNDATGGQVAASRDRHLPSRQRSSTRDDPRTLPGNFRTTGPVDRPADPAPRREPPVGGVDDRVDRLARDVPADQLDPIPVPQFDRHGTSSALVTGPPRLMIRREGTAPSRTAVATVNQLIQDRCSRELAHELQRLAWKRSVTRTSDPTEQPFFPTAPGLSRSWTP